MKCTFFADIMDHGPLVKDSPKSRNRALWLCCALMFPNIPQVLFGTTKQENEYITIGEEKIKLLFLTTVSHSCPSLL